MYKNFYVFQFSVITVQHAPEIQNCTISNFELKKKNTQKSKLKFKKTISNLDLFISRNSVILYSSQNKSQSLQNQNFKESRTFQIGVSKFQFKVSFLKFKLLIRVSRLGVMFELF